MIYRKYSFVYFSMILTFILLFSTLLFSGEVTYSDISKFSYFYENSSEKILKKKKSYLKLLKKNYLLLGNGMLFIKDDVKTNLFLKLFEKERLTSPRAKLYISLLKEKPRLFFLSLFSRGTLLHPLSELFLNHQYSEFLELSNSSKLLLLLQLKYIDNLQSYLTIIPSKVDVDDDTLLFTNMKSLICSNLKKHEFLNYTQDLIYFPAIEKRIYSLVEVLYDKYSEDSYFWSKLYYNSFCLNKKFNLYLKKNFQYSFSFDKENTIAIIEWDEKKKTFLVKKYMSKILNLSELSLLEKRAFQTLNNYAKNSDILESLQEILDIQRQLKAKKQIFQKVLELSILDLDLLYYRDYAEYLMFSLGYTREQALFYIFGDYRARYSRSYKFSYVHGTPIGNENPISFSISRKSKLGSCFTRGLHSFLLASLFTNKVTFCFACACVSNHSDTCHAYVKFTLKGKNYFIDNGQISLSGRELSFPSAIKKILFFFPNRARAKKYSCLRGYSFNKFEISLPQTLREALLILGRKNDDSY